MPPYFNEDDMRRLAEGFTAIPQKAQNLTEAFVIRQYVSNSAREYASHGFSRRIGTLARCIDQIYRLLPPEFDGIPDKDILIDPTIFIQAFVFNSFGALDNLAFVWVKEKNVRGRNGHPLPNGKIGLTQKMKEVRASFSAPMQAYLRERDPWFSHLENFRHSLGHRIPLYIPPYTIDPANQAQYNELEARKNNVQCVYDTGEYEQLEAQQIALAKFLPVMKHSFEDRTPPVVFHAQVLADFATVEEISLRVLDELDNPSL